MTTRKGWLGSSASPPLADTPPSCGLASLDHSHPITSDRVKPIVVFTCGVFDLFHYGHLHFLQQARELGDTLIVGINGDEHVARTRGPDRPIYPLRERMQILNALECVDRVVPFFESDPCKLINRIKPNIVAKGSEYHHGNAPEAALIESLGGKFVIIQSLPIHSSDILKNLHHRDTENTEENQINSSPCPLCLCGESS